MRRFLISAVAALLVLAAVRPAVAAGLAPAAAADDKGKAKNKGEDEDKKGSAKSSGFRGEQTGEHRDDDKGKGKKGGDDDRGEKLPATAAAAVRGTFPGMKVLKVEKEDEDGGVVFEVTLRGKGGTLEAKVTPKGKVVEVALKGGEDEDDRKGAGKSSGFRGEQTGEHRDDDKGKGKKGEDDDKAKGKKRGEDDDKGEKGKKKAGDRN